MKKDKIYYRWYKVDKDLNVISEAENRDFDHSPNENYVLWIEKSGPHGWMVTPDIYDDPIYHYHFFDTAKNPIQEFHLRNDWYLVGMSTIEMFRESYYAQFHIRDPKNEVRTHKLYSTTSRTLWEDLCFIRDELAAFDSWEAYDQHKK